MRRTTAMEISQFAHRLESSCQTLFAFTFIMGVVQSNPLQAAPRIILAACGRTNAGTDPTTYPRRVNSGTPTIMLDYTVTRSTGRPGCPVYAAAHASEQTLPVNISGMASTGLPARATTSHVFTRCDFLQRGEKGRIYWKIRLADIR